MNEALTAFGNDLASMLETEGADYESCIRESAQVNLGLKLCDNSPDTIAMFKEGSTPDLQGHQHDHSNQ